MMETEPRKGVRRTIHWWISDLQLAIVHRAGIMHQAADGLPQLPAYRQDATDLNVALLVVTITPSENGKDDKERAKNAP